MADGRVTRSSRRRGFSLMEVLLGIVVLAFALYGALDLLAASQKTSLRAHRRTVALELARAKMAEIQAAGYDAVAALGTASGGSAAASSFAYPTNPAPFAPPYDAKAYQWQAQFARDPKNPGVFEIEVRVTWDEFGGGAQTGLSRNSVALAGLVVKQ